MSEAMPGAGDNPAVLIIRGSEDSARPWPDTMVRPSVMQPVFKRMGVELHLAHVYDNPGQGDREPQRLQIARNPRFDESDRLVDTTFEDGEMLDHYAVFDRWSANYFIKREVDGLSQYVAQGIDLPPENVWNYFSVQQFGNRKDMMQEIIKAHGAAIDQWNVLEYEALADNHPDSEIIYKPLGESLRKGVRHFETVIDLREAIDNDELPTSGLIQPYFPVTTPIQGLRGIDAEQQAILEAVNGPDRVRELRVWVVGSTAANGTFQVETFPALKYSIETGTKFMGTSRYVVLDPDCIPRDSPIRTKSVDIIRSLRAAASTSHADIRYIYAAVDPFVKDEVNVLENMRVGEVNTRGPGILPEVIEPYHGLATGLAETAIRLYDGLT